MNQGSGTGNKTNEQLIDFTKAREEKLEEKRRKTERIFFNNLLGVYTVIANDQLKNIELIEVSEEGCSFQVPFNPENPWPNQIAQNVPIRFYFSQDTYLPVVFKIQNSRPCIDQGTRYIRFGCSVDKNVSSYEAYSQFVKFLKLYSVHAHQDTGKVTHFYL